MGKPKVRYDALDVAGPFLRAGVDLSSLETDKDGWHTRRSLDAALAAGGLVTPMWNGPARSSRGTVTPLPRRGGPPAGPWGDGDPVTWAYSTDRFAAGRAPHWRAEYRRDPEGTAATLKKLQPVPGIGGGRSGYVSPAATRYAPRPSSFVDRAVWQSASARAGEPPPRLFNSGDGDVPAVTASGLDPAVLHEVPWEARHAIAREPDRGKAFQLLEDCAGPDGEAYAQHVYGKSAEVERYIERCKLWAGRHADDHAVYASMFGDEAAARGAAEERIDRRDRRSAAQRVVDRIDREET